MKQHKLTAEYQNFLSSTFNQFADKAVTVINDWDQVFTTFENFKADDDDPTLIEMQKTARENGLVLRVICENEYVDNTQLVANRVTVFIRDIEESNDTRRGKVDTSRLTLG